MLYAIYGSFKNSMTVSGILKILEDLDYCPVCGEKLNKINIVDAKNTKANFVLVWCLKCKFTKDVYLNDKVLVKCR